MIMAIIISFRDDRHCLRVLMSTLGESELEAAQLMA